MHEEQGEAGRGENKNFMEAENPAWLLWNPCGTAGDGGKGACPFTGIIYRRLTEYLRPWNKCGYRQSLSGLWHPGYGEGIIRHLHAGDDGKYRQPYHGER